MKYVLGIVSLIIVLFIVLLLILGRGGDNKSQQQVVTPKDIVLVDQIAAGGSVRMTNQGRLVGDTERRAIAIVVTANERRLEVLSGFDETVVRTESFPNTSAAYETFLIALNGAGFTQDRESTIKDDRAACPLGRRYIYEVRDSNGGDLMRLWGTTCGKSAPGTVDGNESTIRRLFEAQIPDYTKRVRDVTL